MAQVREIDDDSIDLIKIFQLIWHGKWIVIGTIFITVIVVYFFLQTQTQSYFNATTDIRPISSVEEQQYNALNAFIKQLKPAKSEDATLNELELFTVNSEILHDLYIEQLGNGLLFEEAIVEHELIDKKDFHNDKSFNKAVITLASLIKFKEPLITSQQIYKYWQIKFSHSDEDKWKAVLSSVHLKAIDNVQEVLKYRFNTAVSIAKQKKQYEIDDTKIKIENAIMDYEIKTAYTLSYLKEQAEIARELGISKSDVEAQLFSTRNVMLNIEFDIPFYLKGFEAIEKEIELITDREDKKAFIDGLMSMENRVRDLEQDQTIDRVEEIFNSTPIVNNKNFSAANLLVDATKFERTNNDFLIIFLSVLASGFLSIFYLIVSNAFREREQT